MPAPRDAHRTSTRVLSLLMVLVGFALVIRTAAAGGGALALGVLLGVLFAAAGGARLYLETRRR